MSRPDFIHLDCAAGVPMRPELAAEYPTLVQKFGLNPHGVTCYAEDARRAILDAERRLLALCGTTPAEAGVVWCANGTEAAKLALRGFPWKHGDAPLAIDLGAHPALLQTAKARNDRPRHGFLVGDGGALAPEPPAEAELVALSAVNNETGVRWNGARPGSAAEATVLVDACQAFGKHPLHWPSADLMILSSRKIGGPATGAALLYRRNLRLLPVITGGGQQGGVRDGTLDTVGILLFAKAAETACAHQAEALEAVTALNHELRAGIEHLGHGGWPLFSPADASPYICYFAIPGYEGAIVARTLAQRYGILVGTGSACSAESSQTSPLLKSMGVPDNLARGAIRISFSAQSTHEDLRAFLTALPEVLHDY